MNERHRESTFFMKAIIKMNEFDAMMGSSIVAIPNQSTIYTDSNDDYTPILYC